MKKCLIFLLGFLCFQQLWAQYDAEQLILDGSGATDIISIDVDDDGDLDIVTVKYSDFNSGYWRENTNGLGDFGDPEPFDYFYSSTGVSNLITKVYPADINGDGRMDIVTNQRWIENTGNPNSFIPHLLDFNFPDIKIPGDMDGDGDIDILATKAYSPALGSEGEMFWLENTDGQGNFQALDAFNVGYTDVRNIGAEILDFDGDGDMDVISFYDPVPASSFYVVFENTDGTGAAMQEVLNDNIDTVFESAVGDINGDGFDDVAVVRRRINGSVQPLLLLNSGSGFQTVFYNLFVNNSTDLHFENVDNVGPVELVIGSPGTNYISDDPTTGNLIQAFNPAVGGLITGGSSTLGDFNGDNFVDLVETYDDLLTLSSSNKDLRIVYNQNGTPNIDDVDIEYFIRSNAKKLIRDYDSDGDNDIVFLNGAIPNSQRLELLRNDGAGNFSKEILISDTTLLAAEFEVVDVNNDGRNDILINENGRNFSYLQSLDGSLLKQNVSFFDQFANRILTADVNGDNLEDYIYEWDQGSSIYVQLNNGGIPDAPTTINISANGIIDIELTDVDHDGIEDIVYYIESEEIYYCANDGNGNFSAPELIFTGQGNFLGIADINGDGANDLLFTEPAPQIFTDKVTISYYDTQSDAFLPLEDLLNEDFAIAFDVIDYDNDGDPDIYSNRGVAINVTGTGDFFFSEAINDFDLFDASKDLNGDGFPDVVNFIVKGFQFTWAANNFTQIAQTSGQIIIDNNDDCSLDGTDSFFPGILVEIEKDGAVQYANSSLQGFYGSLTDQLGDYNFELQLPSPYWTACDIDTTVSIVDVNTDYTVDFYLQAEVDCPLLSPSLAISRLRPCIPGQINLSYCNFGTVASEISQATITFPEGLIIDSASQTIISQTANSVVFEIDPVTPGGCGLLKVFVTPDCNVLNVYDVVCTDIKVTPDELCAPLNLDWDGSTIEATGFCVGDSARFILRNIGDGGMTSPRQFRLASIINEDIVMIFIDTFQLDPNEIKTISVYNIDDDAVRLEAEQDPDHPSAATASALVENCQGLVDELWSDLFFSFPQFNGDPFHDFACRSITSSYDPNEKIAEPTGLGDANLIERNWDLEYTVYFQNTGNDTAFTVEIIDTLSEFLDVSTLRINGGSHPFSWEINQDNELKFLFENILLPDSTTDLLGSQGFVEYVIRPKATVPFNTQINNTANIYFDFNEPIITNTTFHTIRKPVRYSSQHYQICNGDEIFGQIFNADTIFQEFFEFAEYDSIAFRHIQVLPTIELTLNESIVEGEFYEGVLIQNDTTLVFSNISMNGCDSITIVEIDAVVSGIDNTLSFDELEIFPNPTKKNLIVQSHDVVIYEVQILSLTGKQIVNINLGQKGEQIIDLSTLPAGTYQLSLKTSEGMVKRLIAKIE